MNLENLKGHVPDSVIAMLPDTMAKFELNTPLRLAHFLAQAGHESGGFKALNENLNKLPVYHDTFSSAVQAAAEYARSKGYDLNEDLLFSTVSTGPRKTQEGKTNRYTLTLFKDGKEQRKALHIQVYGMKNGYELNTYIA